jgi:Tol biopolymer transport system component
MRRYLIGFRNLPGNIVIFVLLAFFIIVPLLSSGCSCSGTQSGIAKPPPQEKTSQEEAAEGEDEEGELEIAYIPGQEEETEPGKAKAAFIKEGDVYIYDAVSGCVDRLTELGDITALAVMKDGSEIAYAREVITEDFALAIIETSHIDGSGKREIMRKMAYEAITTLSYTPEGKYLYFSHIPHQYSDEHICRHDVRTGEVECMLSHRDRGDHCETFGYPSVSPDGTTLACLHYLYGPESQESGVQYIEVRLCLTELDGSNPRDLMTLSYDIRGTIASPPSWSPDGCTLAFIGPGRQVWTVGVDGSDPTQITEMGVPCVSPDWNPDGDSITFKTVTDSYPPQGPIYTIASKGGTASIIYADEEIIKWLWMLVP